MVMFTTVLLVAALAPAAEPLSVEDIKRFTNDDHATLKAKYQTTQFFECFLYERNRNVRDDDKEKAVLRSAERNQHHKTVSFYQDLCSLTNPNNSDRTKIAILRGLRSTLGEAAYKAGGVPPLYPAKYEKDFKAWLAAKFKEGLTTPKAINDAALRQRDAKMQREQQKKKD
jgi:hypothetical protein